MMLRSTHPVCSPLSRAVPAPCVRTYKDAATLSITGWWHGSYPCTEQQQPGKSCTLLCKRLGLSLTPTLPSHVEQNYQWSLTHLNSNGMWRSYGGFISGTSSSLPLLLIRQEVKETVTENIQVILPAPDHRADPKGFGFVKTFTVLNWFHAAPIARTGMRRQVTQ